MKVLYDDSEIIHGNDRPTHIPIQNSLTSVLMVGLVHKMNIFDEYYHKGWGKDLYDDIKSFIDGLEKPCKLKFYFHGTDDIVTVLIIQPKDSEWLDEMYESRSPVGLGHCKKLTVEQIRQYQDILDWGHISYYYTLSEDFIREFKDKLDWIHVAKKQKMSKEFISEFRELGYYTDEEYPIGIMYKSKTQRDFISNRKMKVLLDDSADKESFGNFKKPFGIKGILMFPLVHRVNVFDVLYHFEFNQLDLYNDIKQFIRNLEEPYVCQIKTKDGEILEAYTVQHKDISWLDDMYENRSPVGSGHCKKLSEDIIRVYQDKLDWSSVSEYSILSEGFISEFQDKVDWYKISRFQKLSEEFIRKFQDKVHWECISIYQELSEEFVKEFSDMGYPVVKIYCDEGI